MDNTLPVTPVVIRELSSRRALIDSVRTSLRCTRCGHNVDLPEVADAINADAGIFRSTIEVPHWYCATGLHQGYERLDLLHIVTASVRGLTQIDDIWEMLHAAICLERVEFKRALESACRRGVLFRPTPNWVQPVPQQHPARTVPPS